jgi:hypothetical protein
VFTSLALCAPQDFVNPFVPGAAKPSAGGVVLALCSGVFWALARSWRRSPMVSRVAAVDAAVSAFACVVFAVAGIWLWPQARSSLGTCLPFRSGPLFEAIKAQRRAAAIAITTGEGYTMAKATEFCTYDALRRLDGLVMPLEVLFGGPHTSEPSFLRAAVCRRPSGR